MPNSSKHANDVTFTEDSLKAFIGKIKTDIRDWEIKTDDTTFGYIKYHKQNQAAGEYTRVAIKGFNSSGNFSSSNSSSRTIIINGATTSTTLRSYDGTQYIATDALYAYKQIGSTNFAVPSAYVNNIYTGREFINVTDHAPGDADTDDYWQKGYGKTGTIGTSGAPFGTGYIQNLYSTNVGNTNSYCTNGYFKNLYVNTKLGDSDNPVPHAYIKNLHITSGGSFDGALTITDTTEATRTSVNNYAEVDLPNSFFTIVDTITIKTGNKYYTKSGSTYTLVNKNEVFPNGTKFYIKTTSTDPQGNPWSSEDTYEETTPLSTDCTITQTKKFSSSSNASKYYSYSGSTYTICNTTTNYYNNDTFYKFGIYKLVATPSTDKFTITNTITILVGNKYYTKSGSTYTLVNANDVFPNGTKFYIKTESEWTVYETYEEATPASSERQITQTKFFKDANVANSYSYYSYSNDSFPACTTQTNCYNIKKFYKIEPASDPALGIIYTANGGMSLEGSIVTYGGIAAGKSIKGYRVHAAVFNDYAEYRQTDSQEPGRCVIEIGDGNMTLSSKRLQAGANIVSDTFGFSIGKTYLAQTPIAVCGRVLAYPFEDKQIYEPGDAVCSGPNGTISKMTREEIREWPDRIVGYVSEIPNYEIWGSDQVEVNGRIWIKIK